MWGKGTCCTSTLTIPYLDRNGYSVTRFKYVIIVCHKVLKKKKRNCWKEKALPHLACDFLNLIYFLFPPVLISLLPVWQKHSQQTCNRKSSKLSEQRNDSLVVTWHLTLLTGTKAIPSYDEVNLGAGWLCTSPLVESGRTVRRGGWAEQSRAVRTLHVMLM